MLPDIDATEIITKSTILAPICLTLANQGQTSTAQNALELLRYHVADPAALAGSKLHPVIEMCMPVMIILKCRSTDGEANADLNSDFAYVLNKGTRLV